jgi:hypothetical protein
MSCRFLLAGFQLSLIGRFWVSPEVWTESLVFGALGPEEFRLGSGLRCDRLLYRLPTSDSRCPYRVRMKFALPSG